MDIGLGVGIIASMAYRPERDAHLICLDVPDLFVPNTTHLAIRRGIYLRRYACDLIQKLVPDLTEQEMIQIQRGEVGSGDDFTI